MSATINDFKALRAFKRVFGEIIIYPAEGSKGENMNETTGKIEKRGEKDGKLSIFVAGQWYSQFFNNKNITEDTRKAMESCQIGETWKIGWQAAGDKNQWRNIAVMEREIDVNEDVTTPPTKGKKDDIITYLAVWKAVTPLFSGNLQAFIDMSDGDFLAGWDNFIQYAKALVNTIIEDTPK